MSSDPEDMPMKIRRKTLVAAVAVGASLLLALPAGIGATGRQR